MKPTVINSGGDGNGDTDMPGAVRPTVVKTKPSPLLTPVVPAPVVPTALKPASKPASIPTALKTTRPTALSPTAPTPPANDVPKETPKVVRPTAVAGTTLKRIPVTLNDLKALNSRTADLILERALRLILVTNLDELTETAAIFWGQTPQENFGKHISRCLSLFQSEDLSKTTRHVERLIEILSLIDLKRVCGLEGGAGVISSLFKKGSKEVDSLSELDEALKEIQQISALVGEKLTALISLKDELDKLSRSIDESSHEVEASTIAAAFLADHISREQPTRGMLAQRLQDRAVSLTQTLAQIRAGGSTRQIQVEQPVRLINAVQHAVLVMVPGWLSSIVSIKTVIESKKKPTVTEVNELNDQLSNIITQLKSKG